MFSKHSKKIIVFFVIIISIIGLSAITVYAQSTKDTVDTEMNIYALSLSETAKSEAVLLESKGEYILMDMGQEDTIDIVKSKLYELGVTELSVYFSHLHLDHCGNIAGSGTYSAGLKQYIDDGFNIKNLYLPSPNTAPYSTSYEAKYSDIQSIMNSNYAEDRIIYLETGSTFNIGDINFEVLAPLSPQDYSNNDDTYYENNCSLITMATCGNTKYLTVGDALEYEVTTASNFYGDKLKADIFMMSHHGTASGNTYQFIDLIQPSFTFAQNTTFTTKDENTGVWRWYTGYCRTYPYSMTYYTANEKETLIYHIKNDVITLYKDSLNNDMITGFVRIDGSKGSYRDHDIYYFDERGQKLTGVHTIDNHTYYFGTGGAMEYGSYIAGENSGEYIYQGWKTYKEGKRYFELSEDSEYAYMYTGFNTIDNALYYFNPDTGIKAVSTTDKKEFLQVDNKTYAVGISGALTVNAYSTINGKKYYFDNNGELVKNAFVNMDNNTYYFGEDGAYTSGIYNIDGKSYYFFANSILAKDQLINNNGYSYYFDSNGIMVKSQIMKIGNDDYYFGSNGRMVKSKTVLINNSTYYFDSNGIMVKSKIMKIGNNDYYFGSNGRMVKSKTALINNFTYYFDPNGRMVKLITVTINKYQYYFDSNGKMLKNKTAVINNATYYFGISGKMLKSGTAKIGNYRYYFDKNGKKVSSLLKSRNGGLYYFRKSGRMTTSLLLTLKGNSYYFKSDGKAVVSNRYKVNGKYRYFNKNGRMLKKTKITYKGHKYYCNSIGVMTLVK